MTLTKAITTVAALTGICGALGGAGGYTIGRLAPSVYRTWFGARDAEFVPEHMGAVLGLVQGLAAGAVISVVLVLVVTWFEVRKMTIEAEKGDGK